LSLILFAGTAFAQDTGLAAVKNRIADEVMIQDLDVREETGKVILEGRVQSLREKAKAEEIAEKQLDREVVNNIVLATSQKTDEEITTDVLSAIRSSTGRSFLFNSISVETRGGNVILTGKVRDPILVDIAEKGAGKVAGVVSVSNQIEVLPASTADERLRRAIVNRISRDSFLRTYFVGLAPFSIIVENGRVTLVGSVRTEGDRLKIGSIARSTFGVLSVDNQLQFGS